MNAPVYADGWAKERAHLTTLLSREGLDRNVGVCLCAGVVWRQRNLHEALRFVELVAQDRNLALPYTVRVAS